MADNPNPANNQTATPPPVPPGIVSVNNHGRRPNNKLTPFLMLGAIAAVVIVAGMMTFNVVRAKLAGPKPKPTTTASVPTHRFEADDDDRPPLPGAAVAAAVEPQCADGTLGHELKAQDGSVIRGSAGQTVRVCTDGTVLAAARPQEAPGAAIPLQGTTYQKNAPRPLSDSPGRSNFHGEESLLNDGKYGPAVQVPDMDDSQTLYAAATTSTRPQARTEGLLTAPPADAMEQQLIPSRTPMVQAARIGDLNVLLQKGKTIDCGMSMQIISSLAGQASCIVTQNVYSANGKVVLIERGSEAVGEYRSGVSIGQRRLFVLWTRIITPDGVVINLDSPGADELGSTGLTGRVDNHWSERIGSAFLLSTIKDTIQYETAKAQAKSGGGTFILGNTAQAGDQIADKVLEQTINIPPTIYKNQGDRAVIYVARDLDFSNVYRLRPRS